MTDAELIEWLRDAPADGLGTENLCLEAADRIEDLVGRNKELALQLLTTQGQAAEAAEAKLAALAEAREKVLREAADALRGQGYYTADSAILALIEKPITQGGKGE